jgi:hypothetical protein
MKKIMTLVLSLTLLMSMSIPVFAANSKDSVISIGDLRPTSVDELGVTEVIDNNRIIRTYTREETGISSQRADAKFTYSNDYAETKALLLALGMEQAFIDNLSAETLDKYANSPKLIGVTTYSKVDMDGNAVYIDESAALAAAQVNAEVQAQMGASISGEPMTQTRAQQTYEDSYMRVFYLVSSLGNNVYNFSTDARWLTMPFFRGYDSIGACAMNATVTPGTASGYVSYDITETISGRTTHSSDRYDISNCLRAVNGNWYGSAGVFNLPTDRHFGDVSTMFKNFKAHYEYEGHANSTYFNTIGSYDHTRFRLSFEPSVSIDTSGSFSASIGLEVDSATDTRGVELEITNY